MPDDENLTPGPGEVRGTPRTPEEIEEQRRFDVRKEQERAAKEAFDAEKAAIKDEVEQDMQGDPSEAEKASLIERAQERLNNILSGDMSTENAQENARRAAYRAVEYLEESAFPHIDEATRAALLAVGQRYLPGRKGVVAAELVNRVVGKALTGAAYDASGALKERLLQETMDEIAAADPELAMSDEFGDLKEYVRNKQDEERRAATARATVDSERDERIRLALQKRNQYSREVAALGFSEQYEDALRKKIRDRRTLGVGVTESPIDEEQLQRDIDEELKIILEREIVLDFELTLEDMESSFARARTPEEKEEVVQEFIAYLSSPEMRRKYGREEMKSLVKVVSTKEFNNYLKGGKGNPESVIQALEQARFNVEDEDRELIESMGKPNETLQYIAKIAQRLLPDGYDSLADDDPRKKQAHDQALTDAWEEYYGQVDAFTQRILSNTAAKHDEQFRMNMYEESAYKGIQTLIMSAGGRVSQYLEGLSDREPYRYQDIEISKNTVVRVEEFDKDDDVRVERKTLGVAINEWLANRVISSKDQVTAIHNITYGITQGVALEDLEKYAKAKLSAEFVQRLKMDSNVSLAADEWMDNMNEQIARNNQQIPDDFGLRDENGYDSIDRETYSSLLSLIPKNDGETIPQHRNRVAQVMRKGIVIAWAFDADALHAMKHAPPKQDLSLNNGRIEVIARAKQTHSATYLALGAQLVPFFYHWLYRSPPTMNWLTSMHLPREFDEYIVDGGADAEQFGVESVLHAQTEMDNARVLGGSEWIRRVYYEKYSDITEAIDPKKMGATQTLKLGNADRITVKKGVKDSQKDLARAWERSQRYIEEARQQGYDRIEDFPPDILNRLARAERIRSLRGEILVDHMNLLRRSGSAHVYLFIEKNLDVLAQGYVDTDELCQIDTLTTGTPHNRRLVERENSTSALQQEYLAAKQELHFVRPALTPRSKGEKRRRAEVRLKRAERALQERLVELEVTQRLRDSMPSSMVSGEKQIHIPDYEVFHGMDLRSQLARAMKGFSLRSGATIGGLVNEENPSRQRPDSFENNPTAKRLVDEELFNLALRTQRLAEKMFVQEKREDFDVALRRDIDNPEERRKAARLLSSDEMVFTLSVYDQQPKLDDSGQPVTDEAGNVVMEDSPITQAIKDLYERESSISRGAQGVSFKDIFENADEFVEFMKHYGSHLQAAIGDVHDRARGDLPGGVSANEEGKNVRYKYYTAEEDLGDADSDISEAFAALRIAGIAKPKDIDKRRKELEAELRKTIAQRSAESDRDKRRRLAKDITQLEFTLNIIHDRRDQVMNWVSRARNDRARNTAGYALERDSHARRLAYLLTRNEKAIRTEIFNRDKSNDHVDLTSSGGNFGAKQLGHGKFEAAAIEEENKIWQEQIYLLARKAKQGGQKLESAVESFAGDALASLMKKWNGKDFYGAPIELMKRIELVKRFVVRKPSSQVPRLPFTSRDMTVMHRNDAESVVQLAVPTSKERPVLAADLRDIKEISTEIVKEQKDVSLDPHEIKRSARPYRTETSDPAADIARGIGIGRTKSADVAHRISSRMHDYANGLLPADPADRRKIRGRIAEAAGNIVHRTAQRLESDVNRMEHRIAGALRKVPGLDRRVVNIPVYEQTYASLDLLQRVQGTKTFAETSKEYHREFIPIAIAGAIAFAILFAMYVKELSKKDEE